MKGGTKLYNRSKLNPEKVTASERNVLQNVKGRTAPPGTPTNLESPTGISPQGHPTLEESHLDEGVGTDPDALPGVEQALDTPAERAQEYKVQDYNTQAGGGRRRRGGRRRYTKRRKNRRRTRKAGRRRTRKVKRRSRRRRR